jgi:hypothetical protein
VSCIVCMTYYLKEQICQYVVGRVDNIVSTGKESGSIPGVVYLGLDGSPVSQISLIIGSKGPRRGNTLGGLLGQRF